MNIYNFILTSLFPYFVLSQSSGTNALEIENQYVKQMNQEIQSAESIKPSILELDKKVCKDSKSSSQCLHEYLKTIHIKTPLGYTAYMKIVPAAVSRDRVKNRESKSQSLLSISENLILITDRVDLKKSWLAGYKIEKTADIPFVAKIKTDTIQVLYESKKMSLRMIDNNLQKWEEIMIGPDKADPIELEKQKLRVEKLKSDLQRQKTMTFNYE